MPGQLDGREPEVWANKLAGVDLSRDQIRTLPFTEKVLAHYATR